MTQRSVARTPRTPRTTTPQTTRQQRGLVLYRERANEIRHVRGTVYSVPSCSGSGVYLVEITSGVCTCPDTPPEGEDCKHHVAALIAHAKTTTCSGCRRRFPRREMVEVVDSLSYFEGDELCPACYQDSDAEFSN